MHDKDALSGILWLLEILFKKSGVTLAQRLEESYDKYGYFKEAFPMLQKEANIRELIFPRKRLWASLKARERVF